MNPTHHLKLLEKKTFESSFFDLKSTPRTASESKKSRSSTDRNLTSHKLHPLEVFLIREAIQELKDNNKAVLVDIFARDSDGFIKETPDNKPEIHTIVLYVQPQKSKSTEQEILIIDPNNSEFSKHVAANISRIFIEGYETKNLITPSKSIKIYTPNDSKNVGPKPSQYRDCTDIAVKLAFILNNSP